MLNLWVVVNIGCIECGVSSNIVGVFDDMDLASKVKNACDDEHSWREGGQNDFLVFRVPAVNTVLAEYGDCVATLGVAALNKEHDHEDEA